ncbi:TetR family transcriptional regulator [Kitasatospora herbaricolor]|uniref:TetR/AcrR family transcriptional regulator n=1 Tax=Kitasatospora herbaricolor TaxID=68217 RepID=UPI00174BF1D5|nr:TetR/AcrR family transcriptional regulator [Kitasatospora herbaricolor]MDQ0306951.1 AcrR family transcriptional regulator [Kitasatospora herbaricolor]GGV19122.1 TetR family transcriptional regulator [Kitasatospora herbaricolor]
MKAQADQRNEAGPADGARRRPVQQRSQERYERLVDACAALLDEAGAGALTTKAVAQRAGVPIGTLYQFFAGKESLLGALATRNLERYLDRLARRLEAAPPRGVPGFVDLAVEEFVAMRRAVPGFGQVDFGLVDRTSPGVRDGEHLLDRTLDNNTAVALRLRALGGALFGADGDAAGPPDAGRPGSTLALRVALEAADAVLKLAFRTDPDGDPVLIAECKRLLGRYLADGPTGPAGPRRPAADTTR